MPTTFATWNINSVRLRLPMVLDFISRYRPDILCLQEIKCLNDQFPKKEFTAAGYPYQAVHGQKGYHGVAIVSKHPLTDISSRVFCEIEESRHVSALVDFGKGPLTVHNFYIPAGGDLADPELNPKFKHKLGFLNELKAWFEEPHFGTGHLIAGDFNIAPHENDVWSHKQLLDVVSHTPVETDGLKRILADGKLTDIARAKHKPDEKLYTWWSYRAADWKLSNRGRRLDHWWSDKRATPLVDIASFKIHPEERGGEKPSDHVPVTISVTAAG